ncbi:MAG TPA: nicotinate (nicotinamide) nucleotide adenylyltransferase [Sedimentisphaerales bacterium]|nr:nicotinate (nicotinamide) nucleotide adenylyltransferase [Sedimentisphaerales bacterium]
MPKRKIALFGGTFDPIHLGHTAVAAVALEHIAAEKIIFIPAKRSALKESFPQAPDDDRLNMIALAIEDNEKFHVSDCELRKPQPSYTLETVRRFQAEYGSGVSVCWLVGADAVDDLALWYRIDELIDECDLCVMFRAGCEPPGLRKFEPVWGPERVDKLQRNIVPTPLIDISSTEIRKRLAAGLDVADMLHPSVADYIRKHHLYQSGAES